ncbi:hypothetical protein ACQP60_04280 [Isoptericola variabilis]|uniref:hypothetical protein n=1 Tax=Isoptericola variabilis TaxID=139208 RepID=UPI003D23F88A
MRSAIFAHAAAQWSEMRAEFDVVLEAAYAKAEEGSHGKVLNARGRREGIDPFSLLTGPWSRVAAYAAPELIEHFETVGRPSLAQFEREWLAARTPWEAAA